MSKPFKLVGIPLDLPPEYYASIGEIAARWSWMEWQLHVIIRVILKLDKKQGRILSIGMAVKPMANMIRGLSLRWVPDAKLKNDLQNFIKAVMKFKKTRDELVHGVYVIPENEPMSICLYRIRSAEERILPPAERIRADQIKAAASHLHDLQTQAVALTRRLKASP